VHTVLQLKESSGLLKSTPSSPEVRTRATSPWHNGSETRYRETYHTF